MFKSPTFFETRYVGLPPRLYLPGCTSGKTFVVFSNTYPWDPTHRLGDSPLSTKHAYFLSPDLVPCACSLVLTLLAISSPQKSLPSPLVKSTPQSPATRNQELIVVQKALARVNKISFGEDLLVLSLSVANTPGAWQVRLWRVLSCAVPWRGSSVARRIVGVWHTPS